MIIYILELISYTILTILVLQRIIWWIRLSTHPKIGIPLIASLFGSLINIAVLAITASIRQYGDLGDSGSTAVRFSIMAGIWIIVLSHFWWEDAVTH